MLFKTKSVVALLALAPAVLSFVPNKVAKQKRAVVPGGYIVEFEDDVSTPSVAKSDLYSQLTNLNMAPTHRMDFASPLFKGLSFHVDAGLDQAAVAQSIQDAPVVRKVWPITLHERKGFSTAPYTDGVISTPSSSESTTHLMAHVDKLHAEGLTGKGTFVAIIDSGIDYHHPALGGCFGPGCKVAKGYDLVGDDYTGNNLPSPDPDPYTSCSEHGTHVAGIVGADMNPYNFTGVAPDATIGMYRVFGCDGTAGDDVLIDAFIRAHNDHPDVITASIGGSDGWTENPWTVVVSRIVADGTPCTLSAGNGGDDGLFAGEAAADGLGVIAVGSIDNIDTPTFLSYGKYQVDNSTTSEFGYAPSDIGMPKVTLPLFLLTKNTTVVDDACDPLPADTPNLAGKLVLIRRGTCIFDDKVANAQAFGAEYIMFYSNARGPVPTTITVPDILGVAMVSAAQGVSWVESLLAGSAIQVTIDSFAVRYSHSANNQTGGYMSTYSSWYPNNEAYVKPAISGPGGDILSTLPLNMNGGYGVLSGTSMSTPFVAGVVALMKQARPDLTAEDIYAILGTTGSPVNWNDGDKTYDYLAPVVQQGGGAVNAYAAVHTSSVLNVGNLAFNDTAHLAREVNFTITNRGDSEVKYDISYVNAATAYTLEKGTNFPQKFPPDLATSGASLQFSSSSFSVGAGESEVVVVTVTPPGDLDTVRIPVYSGFVHISGDNGDSLELPYAGIASSLKDATVIDTSLIYPFITSTSDDSETIAAANAVFTISLANTTVNGTLDNSTGLLIPSLRFAVVMPSALVRADLLSNSTQGAFANTTTILGVKTLGEIADSPVTYIARGYEYAIDFYGLLSDNRRVPEGTYSILVRALRIFGDPTNPADYDSAETLPFRIKYVH